VAIALTVTEPPAAAVETKTHDSHTNGPANSIPSYRCALGCRAGWKVELWL